MPAKNIELGSRANMISTRASWPRPRAICAALVRHIPPKFIRLIIVALFVTLLTLHLYRHNEHVHHGPYEAPSASLAVVHGKKVYDVPQNLYSLRPFPDSPMRIQDKKDQYQPWLAAVICAAADTERRMIIRSTWMRLFRNLPFDARFVVSNPGPEWTETVAFENRTFGDIIVLDHLHEDDITANTVKTLEFYKWLTNHSKRYEFVTKMDTDLWINARGFWDNFLAPRLTNETGSPTATVERTVIGELYYSATQDLAFPHGSMYTVTWDMVELLASLQDKFNVVTGEDMAISILMLKGGEVANFVNFKGAEKFDYDDEDTRGDGTAWAREKTHSNATSHALSGSEAIAIHQLKEKKLWFKVADCFDENGMKETPPASGKDQLPPFSLLWSDFWQWTGLTHPFMSRFDRIPDFFWTFEDGKWICDGIWNMGPTKGGFGEVLSSGLRVQREQDTKSGKPQVDHDIQP